MGSTGRVWNAGNKSLRGCSATRPEAADLGAPCRCTPKGLAKISEVGEALDRQILCFPGLGRHADPPFPGGFLLVGSGYEPRANGAVRAGNSTHFARVARLSPAYQPEPAGPLAKSQTAVATSWPASKIDSQSNDFFRQ